jgi:FixJ family two-component response regulator
LPISSQVPATIFASAPHFSRRLLNKHIIASRIPLPYYQGVDGDASVMSGVGKHLVVGVDDDFRLRESLKSLLESAGYAAAVYASAEEFLQSGSLARANCLVTDVRMPGMDGVELQRRIRLQRPELPVIFISAHQDEEARKRALDEGATKFLYKPFDGGELLRTIEGALKDVRED